MRKFKDDRSRAYNDIFPEIGAGDVNVGVLYPGTIKAFHRHKLQTDYWFVVKGNLRAVLYEEGKEPLVYYLGEGEGCTILPGIWHGLQVLGNEEAILIYHITTKYNETTPDEERAPWNAFFDWAISRK